MRLSEYVVPTEAVSRADMSTSMVGRLHWLMINSDEVPFSQEQLYEWNSLRYIAGVLDVSYNLPDMEEALAISQWRPSINSEGILFQSGTSTREILDCNISPETRLVWARGAMWATGAVTTNSPIPPGAFLPYTSPVIPVTPVIPVIPVIPSPRLRVKVWKTSPSEYPSNRWRIKVSKDGLDLTLPSCQVMRAFLPEKWAKALPARSRRGNNSIDHLIRLLDEGVSPQIIHDAVKAWAFSTILQDREATSEGSVVDDANAALLNIAPATLEVGGKVFRLVPTGEVDVRPVLARVRKKALSAASVEVEAMKGRAIVDARIVVSEAEVKATRMRQSLEAEKARLGVRPPDWAISNGISHRFKDGRWYLGFLAETLVTEIRFTVGIWNRILYWNPLILPDVPRKIPCWISIGARGEYTLETVHTDNRLGYTTVHVVTSSTCMALQGLPSKIDSYDNFCRLSNGISRGNRVVNLNSPLSWRTDSYWPDYKAQLPVVVLQFLDRTIALNENMRDMNPRLSMAEFKVSYPAITWDRDEDITEDAQGIFTVDGLLAQVRATDLDTEQAMMNTIGRGLRR